MFIIVANRVYEDMVDGDPSIQVFTTNGDTLTAQDLEARLHMEFADVVDYTTHTLSDGNVWGMDFVTEDNYNDETGEGEYVHWELQVFHQ